MAVVLFHIAALGSAWRCGGWSGSVKVRLRAVKPATELPQQRDELSNRQAGLANDHAQSSLGDFLVVRHDHSSIGRVRVAKDDMTSILAVELVANLGKRRDDLTA